MYECRYTVNGDDWNIKFVKTEQLWITFDVHFVERVLIRAIGVANRRQGLFTEMTPRP